MEDRVLVARLDALLDSLHRVSNELQESTWAGATRSEMLEESLWRGLETTLIKQINNITDELKRRKATIGADDAALSAAWTGYLKILGKSRTILQECLEVIGTLAIRNKDLDKRILYMADELIRSCLKLTTGDEYRYLTTHGMEGTFTKTSARIIRLRFPDWTIWDLPLAAHELGHVLVNQRRDEEKACDEENRVYEPFVMKQRDSLVEHDLELTKTTSDISAKQWAEARVHEFLAEGFATYTMGPAYASSAILLRLDPAVNAKEGQPSHAQRAYLILSMLGWMSATSKLQDPFSVIIGRLRKDWDTVMNHVNSTGKPSRADETWLEGLVQALGGELWKKDLRGTAMYPLTGDRQGWTRAGSLAANWKTQLDQSQELVCPDDFPGSMRDVLNAAWLCRLQIEGSSEDQASKFNKLAKVGQDLCHEIIDATPSTGGGPRSDARRAR
jgi:hypothetical protein